MLLLDKLAERQIEQHLERADCAQNAFSGKVLDLTVDAHVPAQVRALYRVLKHNGYVPAEVALRNEIQSLTQLMAVVTCEQERGRAARRLQLLQLQLESSGRAITAKPNAEYQQALLERFDAKSVTRPVTGPVSAERC